MSGLSTANEVSTPAAPPSGSRRLYSTANGWTDMDSAGNTYLLGQISGMTAGYVAFGGVSTPLAGDANLFWDNTNKRLGIGNATPSARLDVAASVAGATTGILSVATSTGGGGGTTTSYGADIRALNSATGNYGDTIGVSARATHVSSGTVTSVIGVGSAVVVTGAGVVSAAAGFSVATSYGASASITASYGVYVNAVTLAGGGAITAAYGVYVGKQKATGVTTGYGVYQADSADYNVFVGNIRIGSTASPAYALEIAAGEISLDNGKAYRAKDSGGTSRSVFQLNTSDKVDIGAHGGNYGIEMYPGTGTVALSIAGSTGHVTIAGGLNLGTASGATAGQVDVQNLYKVAGTQVVSTRKTGWTAASGTKARTTFVTDSATTAAVAARLGALIDDLISHGLIGA